MPKATSHKMKDGIRPRVNKKGEITGYEAIIRKKDHRGKVIPTSATFPLRAQAKTWRNKTIIEIAEGQFSDLGRLKKFTIQQMMDEWWKGPSKQNKDKGDRAKHIRNRVVEFMGEETLATFDDSLVVEFALHRYKIDNKAASSVRRELRGISKAWEDFLPEHKLPDNLSNPITKALKRIKNKKLLPPDGKRNRRLSRKEFKKIMDYLRPRFPIYALFYEFAALEGMRRAEVARLDPTDRKSGLLDINETKTDVPRTIKLFPRSIQILKLMERINGAYWGLHPGSYSRKFTDAVKALKIVDLRLHDLRHEACSRMADMKMHIFDIQAKLGHKTLAMSERYTKLDPYDGAKEYALERAGIKTKEQAERFGVILPGGWVDKG